MAMRHNQLSSVIMVRTTGRGSMVLDSSSLAVEFVVNDPRRLGLGAVETALDGRANRSGTHLLRSTLGQATKIALREHGG
jgi:hypothetical protein